MALPVCLILATPAVAQPTNSAAAPPGSPAIGMHSMLYLSTPFSAMRAMFAQAADAGVSSIRVDIEISSVFPDVGRSRGKGVQSHVYRPVDVALQEVRDNEPTDAPLPRPHWGAVDEYMRLAQAYHLNVLAVLTSTPAWMAGCPRGTPPSQQYRCAPKDPREWARAAAAIAGHTGGVIHDFEILTEPDGRWSFLGSPQQYALLLADSYRAIHSMNPGASVVLGGLMHLGTRGMSWMNAMLATPGADAAYRFDVANIHVRLPPARVGPVVCQWRHYLAGRGFWGPLWVTESGYPANRAQQTDPGYENGPLSQARWLAAAVPDMFAHGVARVFVTERDLSSGPFASEGVLQTPNPLPPSPHVRRRPGFYTVQRLARELLPSPQVWAPDAGGC